MRTGILIEGIELKKSITRDANGLIVTGIAIGDTDFQNQQFNIEMMPGDFKEVPAIGCGIYQYTQGFLDREFYRTAGISLAMDGYNIKNIEFTTNE